MTMRVIECNLCGETLAGANDEELLRRMREHTEAEHPSAVHDDKRARETIASEAYDASDS
jgi:predicted small metal-binding protein